VENKRNRKKRIQRLVGESMARSQLLAHDFPHHGKAPSSSQGKGQLKNAPSNGSIKSTPASQLPFPDEHPDNDQGPTELLSSIPRRELHIAPSTAIATPKMRVLSFEASRLQAIRRMFTWLFVLISFRGGTFRDRLRRRDSEEARAVRLRQAFEKAGGTFIKFGQQMAMRIDLLPWAYSVELSKMLDKVPPIPFEQSLEVINQSLGKPWQTVFSVIDPEVIGSASIACVYQATLKTGERVAIKVRRPQIGELFAADLKVMDWFLDFVEFLTIIRPGFTKNVRAELRRTLMEELDFVQEARFQHIFRRQSKKSGKKFFTAPRVYFEYSGEEIIVEEFASGMWLWEVMAGVEQGNAEALAMMRQLNIDPQKVAKRLLFVNYWGMQENLFFHADPHPANVVVRPNSQLTFIDFGSSGSFNPEQEDAFQRLSVASSNNNPEMMARATLKLLEPLPPIDLKELMQEVEASYVRVLYVFNSKRSHTQWWERTSVLQWLNFVRIARSYNMPVNLHTLRMMRATLLYDTIAVRLHPKIDRFERVRKYREFRSARAKKRIQKNIRKQIQQGGDEFYLKMEELSNVGEKLYHRTKDLISSPVFNYRSLVEKWIHTISILIKLLGRVVFITAVLTFIVLAIQLFSGEPVGFADAIKLVTSNRVYQLLLAFLVVVNVRNVLFRLRDPEIS
jgi:ubiquinone biosynthesis protein